MDFTLSIYRKLLTTLQDKGFAFLPFCEFLERPAGRVVALRHDVDKWPHYALKMARLEHAMDIRGTYYFRCMPASWDEPVMRQIAIMGHEIGYHYEDLTLVDGDHGQAIRHFEQQLSRLREIYPVKTICMHGSPLSRYDNRDLWATREKALSTEKRALRKEKNALSKSTNQQINKSTIYNYRDYGIIEEPYFDVDFSKVMYLTDTGRRWDGHRVSIRDRVSAFSGRTEPPVRANCNSPQRTTRRGEKFFAPTRCRSTRHIITAANQNRLPNQIMITIHPQRWTNKPLPWFWEFVWQNAKNVVKAYRVRKTVTG